MADRPGVCVWGAIGGWCVVVLCGVRVCVCVGEVAIIEKVNHMALLTISDLIINKEDLYNKILVNCK